MPASEITTSYFMSIFRAPFVNLSESDFTGRTISIAGETFLELVSGRRRHKIRNLLNTQTNERFILVK